MPKAAELKKGMVIELNNQLYIAQQIDVRSPSSRGANTLYKVRFKQVPQGGKFDHTFVGDDIIKEVNLERRRASYLYREDNQFTFMDSEDYSQYTVDEEQIEEQIPFLKEGMEGIFAKIVNEEIIGIDLPPSINLKVTECVPGMQSASATGRTKPAILENGLEVQVPEYIKEGEVIKVSTETGKFVSRT